MGNKNVKEINQLDPYSFTIQEQKEIERRFGDLFKGEVEHFETKLIDRLFENDKYFGERFVILLRLLGEGRKIPEFRTFLGLFEYLAKKPSKFLLSQFNEQTKQNECYLSFLLILLEPEKFLEADPAARKIDRKIAASVIEHLFLIFSPEDSRQVQSALVAAIFEDHGEFLTLEKFVLRSKQRMEYVNSHLQSYFLGKVLEGIKYRPTPPLSFEKGQVFTPTFFRLLHLNGLARIGVEGLSLLYDSTTEGTSFNRLSYSLLGYSAPTLLILKHANLNPNTGEEELCIFGAYMDSPWIDKKGYQGTQQNFLFQLYPQFEIFMTEKFGDVENPPYAYLNILETPNFKTGLGFGGNQSHNKFRIWIDSELCNKSHASADGGLYKIGFVVQPSIQKLRIESCEAWGLGGLAAFNDQAEFRLERQKEREKMRKVDKTQFLNDLAMSSDLFKHREQLREDIDIIKEEAQGQLKKQ